MFDKKKIKLANGRTVTLFYTAFTEQDVITAADSTGTPVAKCSFQVSKVFTHVLTPIERQRIATKHNLKLDDTPEKLSKTFSNECAAERIVGDVYTSERGLKYHLTDKFCELSLIEIMNDNFLGVGLASTMFKEVEKTARENGCPQIRAWVCPFGPNYDGAYGFYRRNGFTFTKNHEDNKTWAIKDLSKTKPAQNDTTKTSGLGK